jgi:carboxymethylenebutenolidase
MDIELTAADGHKLAAYRAEPPKGTKPRGAIVVIQEIFGVNRHMKRVTDGFAADGYVAICPALFDRVKRGVDLGYGPDDIAAGRDLRGKIAWPQVLADAAAAIAEARKSGKVGVVGYCWGGSVAWRAATQLNCDASVGYYGGMVAEFAGEQPKCPVMLMFGEKDASIPLTDVDKVKKAHPGLPVHVYPADHGFNCDDRKQYDPSAAKEARERTLAFFRKHVG